MDEAEKLALFCGATGASPALGRGFLADFEGDVEQAVNAYFSALRVVGGRPAQRLGTSTPSSRLARPPLCHAQ
jgi:hypothetical protein